MHHSPQQLNAQAAPWQPLFANVGQLTESPFWHLAENCWYWVDIPNPAVCRGGSDGVFQRWDMSEPIGCISPASGGGLVIALKNRVVHASAWQGELRTLWQNSAMSARLRFNDGKCDTQGRFWAGTYDNDKGANLSEVESTDGGVVGHGLYEFDFAKNTAERRISAFTGSNGLSFSSNGVMTWADTARHRIWRFASAPDNFRADTPQQAWLEFTPKPEGWTPQRPESAQTYAGRPDGCCIDADDHVWIAMFEGQRLLRASPGGQITHVLATPMHSPTMPALGGPDGRTLLLCGAADSGVWQIQLDQIDAQLPPGILTPGVQFAV
jgi:sugar lactone lactonase YvrE